MLRIQLTKAEKSALEQLRLNRRSNIGERAYYVLLCSQGHSIPEIAKRLDRHVHTVREWVNRYLEWGIKGLISKKQSGRPAIKAPILLSELERLLKESPLVYGYQEAGWQINMLRDYFSKKGCDVCENTLIKALRHLGFVYKRFSKTVPKNAPSAVEKADLISKMVDKLKHYEKASTEILFLDESHFSNQPYVARGWFKKGEKKR